jgi:transposase
LKSLGIARSADTVLRRVKARGNGHKVAGVRVLGVDDWAWRKQQRYGTLLMDLEEGRVIDLLPERSASSFAAWLGEHREVEIISRDRSGLYADGGRQGAPEAAQVTDRYHLVSNLAEALERDVQRLQLEARTEIAKANKAVVCEKKRTRKPTLVEARRQRCRQQRYERYQTVIGLGRQGHSQLAIADRVGIAPSTVAKWLHAPEFPERQIRSDRRRDRPRFLKGIERRQAPANRTHYSSGRVAALLLKPEGLTKEQKRLVDCFLRFCPKARPLRRLALQFRAMLRWRKVKRLKPWMNQATKSGFAFLAQFARALQRDFDAVRLAITTRWNNGPLEGHINRLKVIKRQMYGRAGFELLRARVLPWAQAVTDSCTESA